MQIDQLGNSIFSENDLFELLYKNYQFNKNTNIIVNPSEEIVQFENALGFKLIHYDQSKFDLENFDSNCQNKWFMPDEYKSMDIEEFLVHVCPQENYQRLIEELQEFRSRNMLDLLRWLKYFVDTCRKNSIVWGVGRGSSVSSYILYLIGVHKIDPIKYNLDYKEFLR